MSTRSGGTGRRAGLKNERQFFRKLPQPTAQIRKDLRRPKSPFRRLTQTSALFLILWLQISQSVFAQERIFRVPFHSVNGLILLDGQLNGKPAVFLLDTGANVSFADYHVARSIQFKAEKVRRLGMSGCIVAHEKLSFDGRDFPDARLCVADLSDVSKGAGTRIDGFVGEDFLRQFPAVRIDYKRSVVEFEQ